MRRDRLTELGDDLLRALADHGGRRLMLGLAGCGGSGKSTLAERLRRRAAGAVGAAAVAVVPMDGFHLSNARLAELGLTRRKGSPPSFDAAGFVALLQQLRADGPEPVGVPVYSRQLHEPVPDGVQVAPAVRLIIVEGNYLLLDEPPWHEVAPLLDEVWFLAVPVALAMRRIRQRHIAVGRTEAEADERIAVNDRPNAELIWATRHRASRLVRLT